MDFRGIDPDGLEGVAVAVLQHSAQIRMSTHPALAVLNRNNMAAAVAELSAQANRTEVWCTAIGRDLWWRAAAIRDGQTSDHGLRAVFAAEAPLAGLAIEQDYAKWLAERRQSQERVDAAIKGIADRLSQSFWDLNWDVSNDDLQGIRSIIESLAPDELDRVIAGLTPGQLERWITEMGHAFNGFSREEKQDLFTLLATTASGEALGKVHEAALEAGQSEALLDLSRAIAQHAADRAILDYVAFVTAGDMSRKYSGLGPGLAIGGLDSDAAAGRCLELLHERDGALEAILLDVLVLTDSTNEFDAMVDVLGSADHGTASAFATVAAVAGDRTRLTGTLKDRTNATKSWWADDGDNDRVLDALVDMQTALMSGDPGATIKELAQSVDPDGTILTGYWHVMINREEVSAIAEILRSLRGGDEIDPIGFSDIGPDPTYEYPQARNLAYTAATLNMAFDRCAKEAGDKIDLIGRLAGVATAIAGLLSVPAKVATAMIGAGADLTVDAVADQTKADIDRQLRDLIDKVTTRLRPVDTSHGPLPPGYWVAKSIWTDVYLEIHPWA